MLNFFLGMLTAYIIISFLHDKNWGNSRYFNFIELPVVIIEFVVELLLEIILFPFIFLWRLCRNVIRPVKSEAVQNLKLWEHSTHLVGPIYFCHDKKAKRIVSKFFFFRVLPPVVSDVPDSPKNFRIGA